MKRSKFDAIALTLSAAPLALSQFVWLESVEGSALGGQVFSWLWLPPALAAIILLLSTRSQRIAGLLRVVLAVANLWWVSVVLFHDWTRTAFVLDMATQHSGIQVVELTEVTTSTAMWVASVTLGLSSLSWLAAALRPRGPVGTQSGSRTKPQSAEPEGDSDPRNLWEEQAS